MKHIAWIGLLGLLSAGAVAAQTRMRVSVPFNFIAGEKALPAGEYRVEIDPVFHRVTLSALDAAAATMLPSHTAGQKGGVPENSKLVFNQYGKTCFLRGIWQANEPVGYEMAPSRHEREMARRFARVEVAAVPR